MLILSVSTAVSNGRTIYVDDDGPADFNNIQAAINDSNDGDTIYVFPGRYTGAGNRDIDFGGRAITVRSVAPEDPYIVAATIIDCNASVSDRYRGFVFVNGEESNSVLAGFTIINGYAPYEAEPDFPWDLVSSGGGIYCLGSSPTIMNCVLSNNGGSNEQGGNPYCRPGGGGIYCEDSKAVITKCVLSANYGCYVGGGICSNGGELSITDCEISGNASDYRGGGIYCDRSNPVISDCNIVGNTATRRDGGGVCVLEGSREIGNCIIRGNTCGRDGGGIWVTLDNPIKNCAISCNVAGEDGGGIYNWYNTSAISSCTIVANIAGINCGGVWNVSSYSPMVNCIVWANADSGGTGEVAQIRGSTRGVSFSCIQDDDPNDTYVPFGGVDSNNIDDNPMFVGEPNDGGDGWGDDPGTPEVDEGANDDFGDLHLQSSSPCINAGHPLVGIESDGVDIDGEPRVMGLIVDMGADEFFMPIIVVTKPEGGDVWVSGSLHEIRWDSYTYEGPVNIWFSKDAGSNWKTIKSGFANIGSYRWHLPDIVDSNQCVISVVPSVPDPNVICIESGLFTIHPDSPGPPVTSRWKSLGGDFDRAGLSENYGPELGCVKWTFETGAAIAASITIGAYDRVHISCEDGKLYTLDSNGVLLWSYDTNSPLLSSPSVGPDGSLYVGSEDGRLYAIDINGSLRWTHSTNGFIYSSPAVSADGNNIYVGCKEGILYALARDGSELWDFEMPGYGAIGGSIFASPAVAGDGTVYIGGLYDPNLYALDPNDGSVKWDCNFEYPVIPSYPDGGTMFGWPFASPVVAADGTIYQTLLYDANLYAIEPNDGGIIWSLQLAERLHWDSDCWCFRATDVDGWSEPALGPDGTIYVSLNDANLRAVDPNGSIKWVTRLGMTDGFTLTVGSDGLIYVAGGDGYLCVVDSNGMEVSRFQGDDWVTFPVVSADNTVIVADANRIWAIGGEGCEDSIYHLHRPEDIDGSLSVSLMDFALLAADWLACNDTSPPCEAYYWDGTYFTGDIDRNLYVDFEDLAAITERWLSVDVP